ncbi:MAG: N-6 DNA methylase [Pseudolysinimonas sp.]
MTNEPLLISTSDIAELVEERLPVVSTWRNRHQEGSNAFPAPAGGTPARPLFLFDQVSDWVSRNRPEKDIEHRLLPVRVWSGIRNLTSAGIEQFDLVFWFHLVLAARKAELDGRPILGVPAPATGFREQYRAHEGDFESLVAIVSTSVVEDLVVLSDFTLGRLSAGYGRKGGDVGAVDSNIARVLAAASIAHQVKSTGSSLIYDPSCGIAETVIQVARSYKRDGRQATIIGTEINAQVAIIARVRLGLRDIAATIATGDTLSTRHFPDDRPDLILAEPPLGTNWVGLWHPDDPRSRFGMPSARNADLAWVIDAAARLHEGGQAFVLTSMAALSRGGAEERVRASLLRSGAVETVIALPPNLLQYSSVSLALWVVRAPTEDDSNRIVALVDASRPDIDDAGPARRAEWVRQHVAEWVIAPRDVDPIDGVRSATVHFADFAQAGMDLTPTRWIAEIGGVDLLQNLGDLSNLFTGEVDDFRPDPPGFDGLPTTQHMVTVREITESPDSREAKLWSGRGVSNEAAPEDTITSRDISSGRLRPVGEVASESGFRTEAGDVVFTTMSRVRAVVDVDGGHRLGNGVYALRLDAGSRFDPGFVSLCLSARWNERHQKGATIKHAKPGDLELPLLPVDVQRDWLNAFAALAQVRADAQNLVDLADELEVAAQNALRFGYQEDR